MKKSGLILSVFLAGLALLTGCGKGKVQPARYVPTDAPAVAYADTARLLSHPQVVALLAAAQKANNGEDPIAAANAQLAEYKLTVKDLTGQMYLFGNSMRSEDQSFGVVFFQAGNAERIFNSIEKDAGKVVEFEGCKMTEEDGKIMLLANSDTLLFFNNVDKERIKSILAADGENPKLVGMVTPDTLMAFRGELPEEADGMAFADVALTDRSNVIDLKVELTADTPAEAEALKNQMEQQMMMVNMFAMQSPELAKSVQAITRKVDGPKLVVGVPDLGALFTGMIDVVSKMQMNMQQNMPR